MLRVFMLLSAVLMAVFAASPARAEQVCRNDDATPRPLPAALVQAAAKVFGLHNADPAWVERSTVLRCMGGKLWACNMGANLPCGKANTAKTLSAGDAWCRQNPNADFVPAYISGHDSVRQWRCINGTPAIAGAPEPIDAQGYLSKFWKVLE